MANAISLGDVMKSDRLSDRSRKSRLLGETNRQELIDFLKINNRWYSTSELSFILGINISSIRNHCNNLLNQDIVRSTFFYKYYPDLNYKERKIAHYKHRDHFEDATSSARVVRQVINTE